MRASASTDEIRTAYRALAQRLHPDRQVDASPAERALAERRMREINEAWDVLRDPGRRRAYDDSRRRPSTATTSGAGGAARTGRGRAASGEVAPVPADDDELVDVLAPMSGLAAGVIRHLPWVVLLVVFGVIFVMTAYAGGPASRSGSTTVPARVVAEPGACVDVDPGPVTTIVACSGPHDLQVVTRVDETAACPSGTERRRLAPDGLLDCVVPG